MADQKKIDKASKKISTIYTKGITDIVKSIIDNRKGLTNKEFTSSLIAIDMKEVVKSKLANINKEYISAHVQVLKDVKPPVK